MHYDISSNKAPKMPDLGKGTECIKLLLSQVSKDMYEPIVPMIFPILGAHIYGSEFQYHDLSWKEMCGMMANLVDESGGNKGQLSNLVEAICRDFRSHDHPPPWRTKMSSYRTKRTLTSNHQIKKSYLCIVIKRQARVSNESYRHLEG